MKTFVCRIVSVAGLFGVACSGVGPIGPDGVQLQVRAERSLLEAIGAQTQLELEFPDGMTTVGLETSWRSNNPAIVSVDANGMATAEGQGSATITAEAGGLSASTTITVDARVVTVATVRANQTDTNAANDSASVTLMIHAN